MNVLTEQDVEGILRSECIVSPITEQKITKIFRYDACVLQHVLGMLSMGKFDNYHMIPGNGHLEC